MKLTHEPTGANIIAILEYDGPNVHVEADEAAFKVLPSSKGGKFFPTVYTNRRWVRRDELVFSEDYDWEHDVLLMGGPDLDAEDLAEWPGELPAVQ